MLTLYDELSADYAVRAVEMRPGRWRDRFLYALEISLDVLRPNRRTLASLVSVLVGDPTDGLFASGTAFSRTRVEAIFVGAVVGASDAPRGEVGPALGRLLYLLHLAILLWWPPDRRPSQRATAALVALIERALPLMVPAMRLPGVAGMLVAADALVNEALFEAPPQPEPGR